MTALHGRSRENLWCFLFIIMMTWSPTLPQTTSPPIVFTFAPPNTFCNAGVTPMDQPLQTCGSCKSRCGTLRSFKGQDSPPRYCTCDSKCIAYGDCCPDFETECLKEYKEGAAFSTQFIYNRVLCERIPTVKNSDKSFITSFGVVPSFPEYTFISGCGQTGEDCNRTSEYDLLHPNLAIPVTDSVTGLNYINFQCAKCNAVRNIILWQPQLACQTSNVPVPLNGSVIKTNEDLQQYLSMCQVYYMVPDGVVPRYECLPINRKCPKSCKNRALIDKCEKSFVADYLSRPGSSRDAYYDNYYCAVCNGEALLPFGCPKIRQFDVLPGGRPSLDQFSLSLLFDFNPSDGLTVGQHPCPPFHSRVGGSRECRQVACPEDQRFIDGTCQPKKTILTFISATVFFNKTEDAEKVFDSFSSNVLAKQVEGRLKMNLDDYLKGDNSATDEVELEVAQAINMVDTRWLNLTLDAIFEFGENSTIILESDNLTFLINVKEFINDEMILVLQQLGVDLTLVEIAIDGELTFKQDTLEDCSWFLYKLDEFHVLNSSLIVVSTGNMYGRERYHLVEDTALICVQKEDINPLDLDISPALGIVTIVCISLSIICLMVRIILQFKIHYYRSYAAKLHFNICLSLCLAFITLLLGGIVAVFDVYPLCAAFGVLMYWFFLSAFFWMTAIALDTWLVFRPSNQFLKVEHNQRSLSIYAVPCWLLTAFMASIVIGLDHAEIDPRFQARFGKNLCWFNQRYALLVYLGVPVALTTLITFVLFILVIIHLRRTIQDSVRPSEKESHHLSIYLRLFALMGVSWIIGFVAAFVNHDALWIIFIILNASQGVLIFISFVLRRPVLEEIRLKSTDSSRATSLATNSSSLHSTSEPRLKKSNQNTAI